MLRGPLCTGSPRDFFPLNEGLFGGLLMSNASRASACQLGVPAAPSLSPSGVHTALTTFVPVCCSACRPPLACAHEQTNPVFVTTGALSGLPTACGVHENNQPHGLVTGPTAPYAQRNRSIVQLFTRVGLPWYTIRIRHSVAVRNLCCMASELASSHRAVCGTFDAWLMSKQLDQAGPCVRRGCLPTWAARHGYLLCAALLSL
mmetsp:Transcript_24231/g.71936  ORF Transcript_24231/g.71936 Transcript_24231/m.71936 type:complete len:203 (-) Transcript_24231:3556-4164(-)